jgi:hypothetical protein
MGWSGDGDSGERITRQSNGGIAADLGGSFEHVEAFL